MPTLRGMVQQDSPMRAAWLLARALGCNFIPTTIARVPLVQRWAGLALPGAPRLDDATLSAWRAAERSDLERGREVMAWALLPASGRIAVVGCDSAEWTERWRERQPTPLVVASPTPGRAHFYYRWPDGCDVSSKTNVAGVDTYDLKGRGATCHLPGSLHHRGGRYVCQLPEAELVEGLRDRLPVLDLALVGADADAGRTTPRPERVTWDFDRWSEDGEGERRYAAYLAASPPASRGSRQSTLFRLAGMAGDFGVVYGRALPLLAAWAASCSPPLPADEVAGALARAYPARQSPVGCALDPDVSELGDWDDP